MPKIYTIENTTFNWPQPKVVKLDEETKGK